jgi:hypothetical protein
MEPEAKTESKVIGVSVRGWLAVILTTTTCALALLGITIPDILANLTIGANCFYYGQKIKA